jgi:phage host-nuclease inhibitor protein Gam
MDPINAGIPLTPEGKFRNVNNAASAAGLGEFERAIVSGSTFAEASTRAGNKAQEVANSWPSNSTKPNTSSSKPSESSVSEAINDLNRVNRQLEENEKTRNDHIQIVAEYDKQLATLENHINELITRINNGSTPNREKDLGELRYLTGADYKGGAVRGNRQGEKWTNNSGKEISGEYYKLLNDRNKLSTFAVKSKIELENLRIENEEKLNLAFQRSLSHKLAGNSEIQAAYKIFSLRPRYEEDRKEREDVRIESLNLINTFTDNSDFDPTVRMIAEAEGVDPKLMDKLVSDVNRKIIDTTFHLAKETAILSAGGTVLRVAGLFAEAPMIVKAVNIAADFVMAPEIESLAWIAGKIGYTGLSTEMTVLASEAAKRSLVAQIRIAQILTGEQGLELLVKETTEALSKAASNYNKIADKTSEEGLAAYNEYKQAYRKLLPAHSDNI